MKKVYMVIGYSLVTGQQDIVDYIEASSESEAYRLYEERNLECEANEIVDVYEGIEAEEILDMLKEV